uniref:NADH-ubiquinone oxidoreductase chain 5 n=2 Tax=Omalisus fontisbellaquei TaxID=350094 RepID=A0A0S2MNM3_9COLE|nr:NADH deshydrogenase subunit 5 [Omalisus fontisbellaquei]
MSVCYIFFVLFLIFSILCFFFSLYFLVIDYSIILEFEIFTINSDLIMMSVLLDWMSLLFMSFVLFISCVVVFYSYEYMSGDMNIDRFILLVFMFVVSMIFLILSPNLISILLGWDGLGLVSYCLVIYYQNFKSFNAGMLTALSNRIGDVALLISIAWMLNYGSWNFYFYLDFMRGDFSMEIISFLVLIASLTKSAQIPFSSWLPAAMAAPTPVSSLVHSSTLVTAGVYLLIRFNFSFSNNLLLFLLIISGFTMFMAGLGANYEYDLKKIIALSTLSQLGLMMSIIALGESELAFFHMLTHALFKALLFMCAGCMIHNLFGCQDIRYLGSLISQMPLTCCLFNVCNMALCGIPFLAGFYSKDLILEVLTMGYFNFFVYLIFYFSTGLTVSYSVRLMYYSLFGDFNFQSFHFVNDKGFIMMKGMAGLIFFVVFAGSMLFWMIFPVPIFICLPLVFKLGVFFVIFFGAYMGFELSKFKLSYKLSSLSFYLSSNFFSLMWYMPYISTFGVNCYPLVLGKFYYVSVDNGWSEYFSSQNIYYSLKCSSMFMQFLFNNNIKIYLLIVLIWVVCLFFY